MVITLKDTVYVLRDPNLGAYFALGKGNQQPKLVRQLHHATLAPAGRPECLRELVARASCKLNRYGVVYELDRIDAL